MKNPFLADGWPGAISFQTDHDISERWDTALRCYICWWLHEFRLDGIVWAIEQGYAQSGDDYRRQLKALRARLPHSGIMEIAEDRDLLDTPLMPIERRWARLAGANRRAHEEAGGYR
jgi:hypothetical protein